MTNRGLSVLLSIYALLIASPISAQSTDPTPQDPVRIESAPSEPAAGDEASSPIKARLGIEFAVLSSKIRRSIIRTKTPHGFAVRSVVEGSLADLAEIRKGTIILEVDGLPLREVCQLEDVLTKAQPGQKVVLLCSERKKKRRLLDRKPWVQRKVEIEFPKLEEGKPQKGEGKKGAKDKRERILVRAGLYRA